MFASAALITALGELAIKAGIESIIGNCDASMLRLFRRLGWDSRYLAPLQSMVGLSILDYIPFPSRSSGDRGRRRTEACAALTRSQRWPLRPFRFAAERLGPIIW